MIGCDHVENSAWQYICFSADRLDEPSETAIIDAWLAHMEAVRRRLVPDGENPLLIHWSHAEKINLDTA